MFDKFTKNYQFLTENFVIIQGLHKKTDSGQYILEAQT